MAFYLSRHKLFKSSVLLKIVGYIIFGPKNGILF